MGQYGGRRNSSEGYAVARGVGGAWDVIRDGGAERAYSAVYTEKKKGNSELRRKTKPVAKAMGIAVISTVVPLEEATKCAGTLRRLATSNKA